MEFLRIFGQNVKKYREKHGLSQEEFAYRLSINFSNISRIESGKQFVSAETLQTMLNIFNIPAEKLFENNEETFVEKPQSSLKEKFINYIKVQSDEDIQFMLENSKLFIKHKMKRK